MLKTTKFDLFILDEADLHAIRLWEQVKAYTKQKDQCSVCCSITNKYPTITEKTIKHMLTSGLSIEETEIIAEEIKDLTELEQLTVLMQKV